MQGKENKFVSCPIFLGSVNVYLSISPRYVNVEISLPSHVAVQSHIKYL